MPFGSLVFESCDKPEVTPHYCCIDNVAKPSSFGRAGQQVITLRLSQRDAMRKSRRCANKDRGTGERLVALPGQRGVDASVAQAVPGTDLFGDKSVSDDPLRVPQLRIASRCSRYMVRMRSTMRNKDVEAILARLVWNQVSIRRV